MRKSETLQDMKILPQRKNTMSFRQVPWIKGQIPMKKYCPIQKM